MARAICGSMIFSAEDFSKDLPTSLYIELLEDITAKQNDHREKLRAHLNDRLAEQNNNHKFNTSLSHCPNGSAIALVENSFNIGVDVEVISRIEEKIINRIAAQSEVLNCPTPSLIFPAKEATWKATNKASGITTISQIETTDWQTLGPSLYGFKSKFFDKALDGRGFVYIISDIYMAFFVTPSTFA